ncbi:zinc-dependent alcohol dehydrogenase family protein [Paenibacillus sp. 1P07SE]|uniref:zinc-dependent alcohol dehydrogenase family protein n=1 Tax=Paenibacillus sp. 1P07SE TaxID=3132209 RepID=UPI0039A70186
MQAERVIYERFGEPWQVLQVERVRPQLPGPGELLVRMQARPINPSDLIPIRGAYAHRIRLPALAGYEGVGIVVEAGDAADRRLIGRRVLPLRGEGTWQELVRVPSATTVEVPDRLCDDTAAQAYINPLTAWVTCTDVLGLREGDSLLVNACGSALGRIYAQLSRMLGFELIAVVRHSRHKGVLQRLGAAHVVVHVPGMDADREPGSLRATVLAVTGGRSATAAIDSVGGAAGAELARCVRPGGRLLTVGLLSGEAVAWSEVAAETGARVELFHLRHWNDRVPIVRWRTELSQLLLMMADGRLTLAEPAGRYALADVVQAVQAAELPGAGKLLLI